MQQEDDKPFTVRLSDEAFETYELDPPAYTMNTTKKELKQMYYDMVAMRYVIDIPEEKRAAKKHGVNGFEEGIGAGSIVEETLG